MKPWEIPGLPWDTEAKFLSWIRGILRKGWSRHPVKLEYIKRNRIKVPNPNPNGRNETVWGMECAKCKGHFSLAVPIKTRNRIKKEHGFDVVTIEIDHKAQAGSLKSSEDIGSFAYRLFYVTFDDLQPLCQNCHSVVTLSQKLGLSEEQALAEKQAIAISKRPVSEVKAWLEERNIVPASTTAARRKQIVEALSEEVENTGS